MSVSNERYYVRFKGRVLGPLDHDKTTELIRRGQITRQHELSLDGTQWAAASEFPRLFNNDQSARSQEKTPLSAVSTSTVRRDPSDVWYANINEENLGPVTEDTLASWAAAKKLLPDTLVWKAGMAEWQTAQNLRPGWFSGQSNQATAIAPQGVISDMQVLIDRSLKSHRWIQFLSISGMILSLIALVATIVLFFLAMLAGGAMGPAKLTTINISLCQIATLVLYFIASLMLFNYSARLSALKSSNQLSDLIAATDAANRFWKLAGIFLLFVLFAIPALILISFLTSMLMPALPEVQVDPFQ